MIVPFHQLLKYQNSSVLNRYKKDYPNNILSPEEAFTELLKFLWLCNKHKHDQRVSPEEKLNFQCVIHYEMSEIDDMWHTFLLFTKDYMEFCNQYFKKYIHHAPFTDSDVVPSEEQLTIHLTRYLSYIHDNLGEKTLAKWFGVHC